ncbi:MULTISPECIES: DNA-J related domain-containing protein [Pseudomonas]|uniref:DNA-J related domain-containing protein n=1 Tax=Pseudomonadaceae TaxID=135621 RepID=UPI0004233295|nr:MULTISPECIES: DNA-J related domain-containing protein [Pseudomonas]MDE3739815.1 DNA-J related domain-containing protein [Pseudomonas resinovorans]
MSHDLDPNQDLSDQLHELLRGAPEGLSEYQLIQALKAHHSTHIPHLELTDRLVLFRTHFLVFNALYRLRDHLNAAGQAQLAISPLCVQLLPYKPGTTSSLSELDPLRDYYLDLKNLRDTTEEDVERLLASFWTRMQGSEEKLAALELFGLHNGSQPLSLAVIKQRYRQLVSQHHPDRGGSTSRLQSINKAMEILQRYYS